MRTGRILVATICCLLLAVTSVLVDSGSSRIVAADDLPQAVVIGDSVLHALSLNYGAPARTNLNARHPTLLDTAPCRRLTTAGCTVGGAPAPTNALTVLRSRAGQFSGAVVIGTGYNDVIRGADGFSAAVEQIVAEARAQKVAVVWLTYREKSDYGTYYATYNQILREKDALHPELHVADWNERSAGYPRSWFSGDGIHLLSEATLEMAALIAEALGRVLTAPPTPGGGADEIPVATPAPLPPGYVSPPRCYGDWLGGPAPETASQPLRANYSGGVHVLDTPLRLVDTRQMKGKIGPRLVLAVPVAGVGGIPADATAAIVTVTSVEPCADGFVTLFPCGTGLPTSAVLNAPREKIVSNSAVAMLGGGALCIYNNEPTDVVLDVVGWIGLDGTGVEFTAPVRLVDTRRGEAQALPVPQGRVPARSAVTVDVTGSPDVRADSTAITFNLTAVDPSAAGFVSSLPGRCSDHPGPPSTASLTFEARRTTGVSATVGIRDGAFCIYTSAEVDLVVDLQSVHIVNQHYVLPINPLRLVDTRITGPVPANSGVDLDVVLGAAAHEYASGVILNVAGVAPTRSGYIVVYSCNRPSPPFVSSLYVTAGTTVSNRAFVSLELGRALCVYSNIPTHLVIDIEAWVP